MVRPPLLSRLTLSPLLVLAPRTLSADYKGFMKQHFYAHADEADPERIAAMIQRGESDMAFILKKYAGKGDGDVARRSAAGDRNFTFMKPTKRNSRGQEPPVRAPGRRACTATATQAERSEDSGDVHTEALSIQFLDCTASRICTGVWCPSCLPPNLAVLAPTCAPRFCAVVEPWWSWCRVGSGRRRLAGAQARISTGPASRRRRRRGWQGRGLGSRCCNSQQVSRGTRRQRERERGPYRWILTTGAEARRTPDEHRWW